MYLSHLGSPFWGDGCLFIEINQEQHWGDPPTNGEMIYSEQSRKPYTTWESFLDFIRHLTIFKSQKVPKSVPYMPPQNRSESRYRATHFGVWTSFCSLAACRQGWTTSKSLIRTLRMPLDSTTQAQGSFNSWLINQRKKENKHQLLFSNHRGKHIIKFKFHLYMCQLCDMRWVTLIL